MTDPGPPAGGPSPLRLGGFVLLGIAAVSAIVGLVSLAGGGDNAKATTPSSLNAAPAPGAAGPAPSAAVPPAPAVPPSAPAGPPPAAAIPPAPGQLPDQPPAPGALPAPGARPAGPPPVPGAPPTGHGPVGQPPAPGAPPGGPPPGAQPPTGPPPVAQSPAPPSAAPNPLGAPAPAAQKPLPGAGLPGEGTIPGYTGKGATAVKAPVRVYNNSLIKELAAHAAADFRDSGWDVTEVGNYPYGTISTSTVYYRPGTEEQAAAQALANSFGMRAEPRFAGIANADPGLIVIVTKDYQRR